MGFNFTLLIENSVIIFFGVMVDFEPSSNLEKAINNVGRGRGGGVNTDPIPSLSSVTR